MAPVKQWLGGVEMDVWVGLDMRMGSPLLTLVSRLTELGVVRLCLTLDALSIP